MYNLGAAIQSACLSGLAFYAFYNAFLSDKLRTRRIKQKILNSQLPEHLIQLCELDPQISIAFYFNHDQARIRYDSQQYVFVTYPIGHNEKSQIYRYTKQECIQKFCDNLLSIDYYEPYFRCETTILVNLPVHSNHNIYDILQAYHPRYTPNCLKIDLTQFRE